MVCNSAFAQEGRIQSNIDFNWYFHQGDIENGQQIDFPHSDWRMLNLPHDWSIEAGYSKDNPGGGAMGFLPGGIGYGYFPHWH
jgi:beta-galactosidase